MAEVLPIGLLAGPPRQRPQARLDLAQRERLDEVVVGTAVEASHAVIEVAARGQDQHREVDAVAAPRSQHVEPVAVRQAEIQYPDVVRGLVHRAGGFGDGAGHVDGVAALVERRRNASREHAIVLDEQQPHQ